MGDDDPRRGRIAYSLHQGRLVPAIQPIGGFVEDDDARVAHQRPGDPDALALPARDDGRAFSHAGVHLHRHGRDIAVDRGLAGGAPCVVHRQALVLADDVVENGADLNAHVLKHRADLPAHRDRIEMGKVAIVVVDGACGGRFETEREAHQRALAGARLADDGDEFAGARVDVDAIQYRRSRVVVSETHGLETKLAAKHGRRAGPGSGIGAGAENGQNLFAGRPDRCDGLERRAKRHYGRVEDHRSDIGDQEFADTE